MAVAVVVVAAAGSSAYFRTSSVCYRPTGSVRRVPVIHKNPASPPQSSEVPSVVVLAVAVVVVRTRSKGSPSTGCRGANRHQAAGRTYRTGSGSRRTVSWRKGPSTGTGCYGRSRGFYTHPSSDYAPGRCGTRGTVVVVDFGLPWPPESSPASHPDTPAG
uniref:Putative secreted protein n=1 Tax=Anopheles marajoara TaxID=58244 RepID=A0A2M4C672_9DIPT